MYAANMAVGAAPLLAFIRRLARAGTVTARDMYGCNGWVAHGFVDSDLDTGMLGDAQWAMCVTCGAWLALHLWEHLAYQEYDEEFVKGTVIPVFRGIAQFFLEYSFVDGDGLLHTGPSTSPENSQSTGLSPGGGDQPVQPLPDPIKIRPSDVGSPRGRLKFLHSPILGGVPGVGGESPDAAPPPNGIETPIEVPYSHLAFSPAIDISVLRQVRIHGFDGSRNFCG